MADLDETQSNQDIVIRGSSGDVADVTVDNRLKVDAQVTPNVQARVDEPVLVREANNTDQNKLNYEVPAGKILFVQAFAVDSLEANLTVEWQVNEGSGFSARYTTSLNKDGTTSFEFKFPENNPVGPIPAGSIVRARRVAGDTGKEWSAYLVGYLEDAP